MRLYDAAQFKGGWFVGDFAPSVIQTPLFEVCYKLHAAGEQWDTHYHKLAVEVNYLIEGSMKINDQLLAAPIVFVLDPMEIAKPEFLTDVKLIIVKMPSDTNDKYIVDDK
jgi:hypothetical protein